jgi:hypothetical protein
VARGVKQKDVIRHIKVLGSTYGADIPNMFKCKRIELLEIPTILKILDVLNQIPRHEDVW